MTFRDPNGKINGRTIKWGSGTIAAVIISAGAVIAAWDKIVDFSFRPAFMIDVAVARESVLTQVGDDLDRVQLRQDANTVQIKCMRIDNLTGQLILLQQEERNYRRNREEVPLDIEIQIRDAERKRAKLIDDVGALSEIFGTTIC